jgi:hypothetical protein
MKTRPEGESQLTTQWVCSISCECGRSYIGETGRPLAVRLREHRHNFKEGLLEKSKLAQHAYEENHKVDWHGVRILVIERNSKLRKHKESAHMAYVGNSISQPSFNFPLSGFHWFFMKLPTHSDAKYDVKLVVKHSMFMDLVVLSTEYEQKILPYISFIVHWWCELVYNSHHLMISYPSLTKPVRR